MANSNLDKRTSGLKRGGSPVLSRVAIYNKLSAHSAEAIKQLIECLTSTNENIKLGAIKILLDKVVPDIKAMEISGEDKSPIKVRIIYEDNQNNQQTHK